MKNIGNIIIGLAMIITIMFIIGVVLDSLEEYYPVNVWCKTICKLSLTITIVNICCSYFCAKVLDKEI
jgi:hypothetical protein